METHRMLKSLNLKQQTLKQILQAIENQVEYRFVYSDEKLSLDQRLSISKASNLSEMLDFLEKTTPSKFKVVGKNIVVTYQSLQTPGNLQGKIVDQLGNPLVGATIEIIETGKSYTTDSKGEVSISLSPGKYTVKISYLAYETQQKSGVEIFAGKSSSLRVNMIESSDALSEIVVIGYGTIKRSDLTGSVTDIDAEKLKDQPTTAIDQQLVGRVAGMQVSQTSGAPGAGTSIKIRGNGSLGAGNDPLFVIDGMPYSSESSQDNNPLNYINPSDIANISVLKDASSTAIYGSRGANGVIIITTKNAGKEKNDLLNQNFYEYKSNSSGRKT